MVIVNRINRLKALNLLIMIFKKLSKLGITIQNAESAICDEQAYSVITVSNQS